jgi:hypothetical protein
MHDFFLFLFGLTLLILPAGFIAALIGLSLRAAGGTPAPRPRASFDFDRLGGGLALVLMALGAGLLILLAFVHPLVAIALTIVLWFLSSN